MALSVFINRQNLGAKIKIIWLGEDGSRILYFNERNRLNIYMCGIRFSQGYYIEIKTVCLGEASAFLGPKSHKFVTIFLKPENQTFNE